MRASICMSAGKYNVNEATAVITVPHDLDRREEPEGSTEYSPEWETKTAISQILDIVLKPISFTEQLTEILDVIVSISWLRAKKKGGIFVANRRKELVLTVQQNMTPVLKSCGLVPFGRCLCGKAAAEKRILFRTCMGPDHEIHYPGMTEHGHYNIPLLDNRGEVIGVLVLYLEPGHQPHPEERHFTAMLGRAVSGVILGRDLLLRSEINRIRLQKAQQDMLHKLVAASEFRDDETGEHIKRLSGYAAVIGKTIGLSDEEVELLELAIPMHDVGKMGIPDKILLKPGKLTTREFSVMQQHTEIGAKILSGSHPLMVASRQIALSHHEMWDGSGYPYGLSGDEIPLFARICALVDVFDALTTKRPYKEPWPLGKAVSFLQNATGSHFDPQLVDAFMQSLPQILEVKSLYHDSNGGKPDARVLEQIAVTGKKSVWKQQYSVGIDLIDDQHRYLINLIDRIDTAIEENDSIVIVQTVLDMKLYSEIHFVEEEELMRNAEYPGFEHHVKLHQQFIEKTDMFLDEIEQTPLAATAEISTYLKNWLVLHIQRADSLYAQFIREKG